MKRLAIALAAAAMLASAAPASAQGLYVGVGDPYYGGWGANWGTWSGGYGGYWGGAVASWGVGPGYYGGPTYAYAWDNPGYTVTYRRPRARVYAYETAPRYRYRRVARDRAYEAYAYSGPEYGYVAFGGPRYRDWAWGW